MLARPERSLFGVKGGLEGAVAAAPCGVGVAFVPGSGVTSPKRRCSGFSRPRWIEESSLCVLPDPPNSAVFEIDLELPPDGVADAALERPQRLFRRLALGELAVVVDAYRRVAGDLGDRDQVQRVVDLSVPAGLKRCRFFGPDDASIGAVPGYAAKRSRLREPAGIADLADDDRGDDRADTVDLEQRRVRRGRSRR